MGVLNSGKNSIDERNYVTFSLLLVLVLIITLGLILAGREGSGVCTG